MEKINTYKTKEFAEILGVSVSTLIKWDRRGWLKAYRTPSNRPFYTDKHYDEYMNKKDEA